MSLPNTNTNTNTNTTTPSPRFSTNPPQQQQPRNVTAMPRGSYPHRSHIPRSGSVSSYPPPPPSQQVHPPPPPPPPNRVVGSLYTTTTTTTTTTNNNHNNNMYYNSSSTSSPSQCQGIPYNNNNSPLHGYHNNYNNNNNCYSGNTVLLPPHPPIYSLRALPLPPYHQTVPSPAPAPAPDSNGYKDSRSKEDSFITVRDRKVRVSASSSLYAACRSWLRNGVREETQPHYLDGIKLLPKPSPPPVPDAHSPAEPTKEEEEEESIEHLSPKDLLKRHVKRAKKVRARLRDERLQRIARYKTRLALLLPPLEVQQHQFRNESAAGN